MKRVLIGGLVHETHTFLAETTDLQAFSRLIWVQGSGLLDRCQGDVSPMGGALEVAQQRSWRVYPSVYGAAMPSGTVRDEVLETWWQRFGADLDQALQEGLDGILLILHGAMAFTSFGDGEGELLRRVRDRLGERRLPIPASPPPAIVNPSATPRPAAKKTVRAIKHRRTGGSWTPSD